MKKTDISKPVSLPKKTVAKLLATENIDVVSEKIPTAYFDLKNRRLAVPVWEDVSQNVYDLLVGHEVGHALYTPLEIIEECKKRKIPKSFINVVEDIRIEKMIQNKYPGLIRNFKTGYVELTKRDFFGIKTYSKSLEELGLIDRLNIFAKTKNNDIKFLDKEQWVFDEINKMTTWLDAVNFAEKLATYMEDNKESQGKSIKSDGDISIGDETTTADGMENGETVEVEVTKTDTNSGKEDKDKNGSDENNESVDIKSKSTKGGEDWKDDYSSESITDKNLQKKLEDTADTTGKYLNVEMPAYDLDEVIVDYEKIAKMDDEFVKSHGNTDSNLMINYLEKDFKEFKNTSMQNVNYLVKEFEMKKSADNYARATISKQGSLNLKLLHKYKFEDDLFLKVTNIPDGKSHGLIFYLDWSGSMDRNLTPTIKQLFNLIWFAKKTNIPFEVYAFTNGFAKSDDDDSPRTVFSQEVGQMRLLQAFNLFEICNSKMNNAKLNEALKRFYGLSKRMSPWTIKEQSKERDAYYSVHVPRRLQLGGTPLIETAYVNIGVSERFMKTYGVDKLNICYLTDGYGMNINTYHSELKTREHNGKFKTFMDYEVIPTQNDYAPHFYKEEKDKEEAYLKSNTHVKVGKYNSFDIPPPRSYYGEGQGRTRGDSKSESLFAFEFEQLTKIVKQNTNCNIIGFHLIEATKNGKVRLQEMDNVLYPNAEWVLSGYDKDMNIKIDKEEKSGNKRFRFDNTITDIVHKIGKDGVYNVQGIFGFDDYFLLPGGKGLELTDVELSDELVGANKRKLTKEFGKNRSGKLKKRVLCNKFIDRIS